MIQPDEIIRSNRRTLALSVDSFGRLIVRAPKRFPEQRIFAFIQEKEAWILRKKAERQGAGIKLPPENLNGYTLLLLGKQCTLYVVQTAKVGYDAENNAIYLPEKNPRERLIRWLKNNAKRILSEVTERTAKTMGTTYKSVNISSAKSRWGSCSGEDAIRYSFRLIYAPKEVIEYVVVHELAHTKHKNHSKAFWTEVATYVPDWKAKRKWLKLHGALMEIF
ncbi:MAG: M48 family metallopeptidase [Clostridia bacterium]|nr:M48 family metallopeptidase [Clostridia bacterium]